MRFASIVFPDPGEPDHQNVVAAGAGDFEGSLRGLLPTNVFEIYMELLRLAEQLPGIDLHAGNAVAGIDVMNHFEQRFDGVDLDALDHGGLAGVDLGHNQPFHFCPTGFDRNRQSATHATQSSIERKFAHEQRVGDLLFIQAAVRAEDAERHRQVEAGPFFTDVGWRQIDGDLCRWNIVAAIFQRRANSVAAFADSRIRQADRVKVVFLHFDAGDIHFHFNDVGVNAIDSGTQGLIEHRDSNGHTKGNSEDGRSFATSYAPQNRKRCDGHHPFTVMEPYRTF